MAIDWHHEIVDQLDFYWDFFRRRLDGLTDDEYFWEPVAACWSVRPTGHGTFSMDGTWPPPEPPPFTTIAWRLCHIVGPVLGFRASSHFGDGSLNLETITWPGTADDALARIDESYAAWNGGISALDDAGLARAVGPAEGPYSEHPMATLILHISREVMHHGAEVALLRDLYRDTTRPPAR